MKRATSAVRGFLTAPFVGDLKRRGKRSLVASSIASVIVAGLVGCADMKGVKSANLNRKLPEPDAEFMKRVERDPFPVASSISPAKSSAQAKTKDSKR